MSLLVVLNSRARAHLHQCTNHSEACQAEVLERSRSTGCVEEGIQKQRHMCCKKSITNCQQPTQKSWSTCGPSDNSVLSAQGNVWFTNIGLVKSKHAHARHMPERVFHNYDQSTSDLLLQSKVTWSQYATQTVAHMTP